MLRPILLSLIMALGAAPASAQTTSASPTPPQRPNCNGPERHELDFWVGEWNVFDTAKGYQIATSTVESIANGCAIKESYESPKAPGGPYSGTSYSSRSRLDNKWHQMYVDVNGNVGLYVGGLEGPDMVLIAPTRGGAIQKMTYRPHPDGSVEQIGVISADGGKSWTPGYDYTYRKR